MANARLAEALGAAASLRCAMALEALPLHAADGLRLAAVHAVPMTWNPAVPVYYYCKDA